MLVLAVFVGLALARLGSDIGFVNITALLALLIAVLAARPVIQGLGASAEMTTRPAFSVGGEIEVDDVIGQVVEITNRSTVLQLRDGRKVHIPNVNKRDAGAEPLNDLATGRCSPPSVPILARPADRSEVR